MPTSDPRRQDGPVDHYQTLNMADDNFFAMPPPEDAPAPPPGDDMEDETGGFTFLGDAPAAAPFVGDVDETMGGDAMGFAGVPHNDFGDTGFASAPDSGYHDPGDAFGGGYDAPDAYAPPAEDTPIILGPPAVEMGDMDDMEMEGAPAVEPSGPSPMAKWNAEWQELLQVRKDNENTRKAELVEAARVSMEKFQKERESKREARMSKNREDEQAKLEAIEADLENDNSWQKVCKMVELTHDGAQDAGDVKRMRDVMILLKNDTARATSVGA
jgi:Clathrin light chain